LGGEERKEDEGGRGGGKVRWGKEDKGKGGKEGGSGEK